MSSNSTPTESKPHLKQRKTLIKLEAEIDKLELHTLDASQLDKLNIKRQPMTLNEDSDLNPRFFAPIHNLPQPSDKLIREVVDDANDTDYSTAMSRAHHSEAQWSVYAFQLCWTEHSNDNPWRSMPVIEYNTFKSLHGYDKPDFGVFRIRDATGPAFPHMKAATWNSLETEGNKVCRGELLIILRLMLTQLRKVRLLHHHVAPIMIVSFIGKRARLLESYFEGESLILRCSDLYDFSGEETTSMAYKAFTKWYLGPPTGKTV